MGDAAHERWATMLAQARAFAHHDPSSARSRARLVLREIDEAIAGGDASAHELRAQVAAEHASYEAAVKQQAAECAARNEAYHTRIRHENEAGAAG